ncbi:uncharacterized protein LOC126425317 [Schistocerca serialis cubense]|uniref:uncharacterized protein LOC126425317 n=1 Tax=Schistocerca serialis cubense TaxID=2023355 RepID=UPI00214F3FD5|nr:uncharacterized protein LOC126425317 [Schistocerca serialis cubense]
MTPQNKRAIRIITHSHPRTHCKPIFKKLRILTIPSLYIYKCVLYVWTHIADFQTNADFHNYNTRNSAALHTQRTKRTNTQRHVNHIGAKLYNTLPVNIRQLEDDNKFKTEFKKFLVEQCFYSVNDYVGQ